VDKTAEVAYRRHEIERGKEGNHLKPLKQGGKKLKAQDQEQKGGVRNISKKKNTNGSSKGGRLKATAILSQPGLKTLSPLI